MRHPRTEKPLTELFLESSQFVVEVSFADRDCQSVFTRYFGSYQWASDRTTTAEIDLKTKKRIRFTISYLPKSKRRAPHDYLYSAPIPKPNDKVLFTIGEPLAETEISLVDNEVHSRIYSLSPHHQERAIYTSFIRPLRFLMLQRGVVFIHAAYLRRQNIGILIAGPSGSGKSTLGHLLYQRGFTFHTDENTFLSRSAQGSIEMSTLGLAKAIYPDFFSRGQNQALKWFESEATSKLRVHYPEPTPRDQSKEQNVDFVVFPRPQSDGDGLLTECHDHQAMRLFLEDPEVEICSARVKSMAIENLALIRQLTCETPCYHLSYKQADFLSAIEAISPLIS